MQLKYVVGLCALDVLIVSYMPRCYSCSEAVLVDFGEKCLRTWFVALFMFVFDMYIIMCNTVGFLHASRCVLTLISGEAFEALSVLSLIHI